MPREIGPTPRTDQLCADFAQISESLVDAAIRRARAKGYARFTTTIRAAWEEAVAAVSESLGAYLPEGQAASDGPHARIDYAADPRFARLREVAIRHRAHGVSLQHYLGFLKHFREIYLEVLGADANTAGAVELADRVRGFFDLAELGIAAHWADCGDDTRLRDMQSRNRAVTLEKDRYFAVFESLRDPAFLLDRERRLITGNQAAAELFVGEAGAGEIVYLSTMRARKAPLERALRDLDLWSCENPEGCDALWIDTRMGRLCFDVRVRQIHDAVQNLRLGYVAILHDVTEHRRATDESMRAQRAMSQFLATMSHEIRTPLHGVLGAAELLRDSDPERIGIYRDAIQVTGRHLLQTLNKVLDYSRLEARPPAPKPRVVDLRAVLDDYARFATTLARNAGVDFRIETTTRLPAWIDIDWEMAQQVLTNLISNAVRHTRTDITLAIRCRAATGRRPGLRFEVRDGGAGIAPDVAQTLFEPFGATTPGQGETSGSGLGLAICRRLVTAMEGEIGFCNRRTGATFWFEIPLVAARRPSVPAALASDDPTDAIAGLSCLIVDDDAISRFVTVEHLRRLGAEPAEAASIRTALDRVAGREFDVFLIDYHLPDGDGVDLLAKLAQRGRMGAGRRAVALTANAELISGGRSAFDAVVAKPATSDALRKALTGAGQGQDSAPPRQAAHDLDGVSPGILRTMVSAFETQWGSDRAALLRAFDTANGQEAAEIAHRMASSCTTLGFVDLAEELAACETRCRRHPPAADLGLWRRRLMPLLDTAPARASGLAKAHPC